MVGLMKYEEESVKMVSMMIRINVLLKQENTKVSQSFIKNNWRTWNYSKKNGWLDEFHN